MIKFFRRIRYNLMETGKTGKYFKYAIGEIVLVVIGILIALQINNWNEERVLRTEEQKILKSLHSELKENSQNFDFVYDFHITRDSILRRLLKINPNKENFATLDSLINKIDAGWTYNPSRGIYRSIINSGKIDLIKNDSLKNKIAKLSDITDDYLEDEEYLNTFTWSIIEPLLLKWFNYYATDRTTDERIIDSLKYVEVIPSRDFKNHLAFILPYLGSVLDEGPIMKDEIESIIKMINHELSEF